MMKKALLTVFAISCGFVLNVTWAEATESFERNQIPSVECVELNNTEESSKIKKTNKEAERVIRDITTVNNLVNGKWDAIEMSGLTTKYYDEILKEVEENGNINGYRISETTKSENETTFVLRVERTIYLIEKGDTLSQIAQDKKTTVEKLMELNPQITDPNMIYYGTIIRIK